jgi:peptide/nickel transport system substrate-binding protein
MRTRTTRSAAGVAGIAALALTLAACGGSSSGGSTGSSGNQAPSSNSAANSVNTGTAAKGGSFTYTLEKDIPSWNVNSALGNTFETDEVVEQIYPSVWNNQPDPSTVALNKDLMVSAEETSTSPETITYKIQPDAAWSDGQPIDANDFIYFWKAQNGKDCPKCQPASTTGYEDISSITSSNGGKTATAVFGTPFGDWKALFGGGYGLLPSHLAQGSIDQSFNKQFNQEPTVSGGPFILKKFTDNQNVQLVRNDKYYGTPANLDTLNFRIISDATQEPTAIQNKEVDAIYPQPELDLLNTVEGYKSLGITNQLDLGLNWEHFDFNLNNPFLKDVALRQALFTAINRQHLIDQTVGQFDPEVKPLNNRFFMPQQSGYQDTLSASGLGNGDLTAAKKILTDAGYTGVGSALTTPDGKQVPTLAIKYTVGNTIRQTECQIFAQTAKQLGVNVDVSTTDDLGATLTHADKQHDYDVVVFAWVGAPFPTSGNAPNYITGAGNNFGAYSNPQVDNLLKKAVKTSDPTTAATLDNQADTIISKDAYTLPLYQKPTFLAVYNSWVNIRDNATGQGPPYNAAQWGSKDSAS